MPFSDLTAPAAALRVCVDSVEPGRLSGLVYGQRLTAPMAFSDWGDLLLRLDEVLDKQKFPQAFQRSRSFTTDRESGVPAAGSPEEGLPAQTIAAASGRVKTFLLYVTSRRNSSWQGYLDWMDETPNSEFESALELLRLIEERI